MAKIRRKEDLPDWFDLNNYESCKSFKAIDWAVALNSRRLLLELIDIKDIAGANELAERIREAPADCFRLDWEIPESPVRALTFSELAAKGGAAQLTCLAFPEKSEKWVSTLDAVTSGRWLISSDLNQDVDNPSDILRCLVVNLNATDSVLKEAFAEWLEGIRGQIKIGSKRERPAYEKWHRYGLLPYLDLLCWEKITGNKVPLAVMSIAVGYGGESENFRKNVPVLCKKLPRLVCELEALAAIQR